MELSEIRKEIDGIDSSLVKLVTERLKRSLDVAKVKCEGTINPTVYVKEREDEILERLTAGLAESEAKAVVEVYKKLLVNSRALQYVYAVDNEKVALDEDELISEPGSNAFTTLVCQGIEGAYSSIAAREFIKKGGERYIKFVKNFEDVFKAIDDDTLGVLPLENSTAGSVGEVYDLFLKYGLYIVKSYDLSIRHCLLANKDATLDSIKSVTAHPQALMQCSSFIVERELNMVNAVNNAVASKEVSESGRVDIAAISAKENAKLYSLKVLSEDINNSLMNTTRFVLVSNKLIVPKSGGKVSLVFSLENSSGTLANVLNIFSAYSLSMSKIESRPLESEKWAYRFYVDIEGNIRDRKVRAMLYQLKKELPFVRLLGSYDAVE